MMRVLGVDPSLKATGVCLPDGQTFTLKTGEAHIGDYRLHLLRQQFRHMLRLAGTVTLAVIEVPTRFQSGDAALAAGMAQGLLRELLVEYKIPFAKINPQTLKSFAVGKAGGTESDKAHMVAAANRHRAGRYKRLSYEGTVGDYEGDLTDDNQADAWWLKEMGRWHLGEKDLDPDYDSFLHAHLIRDAKTIEHKGAKWPGLDARTAARASRATRSPHRPQR